MRSAVLGHTGLVGSHIMELNPLALGINRSNISELASGPFETLFISALPAEKWKANQNPADDLANLEELKASLELAEAANVILISTVDVFSQPHRVYEHSPAIPDEGNYYGAHRLMLESFVIERFQGCKIIRLPGLISPRLKKNLLFDIKHNRPTASVAINSVFQFYPLSRLGKDLEVISSLQNGVYHLTAEPLPTERLVSEFKLDPSKFTPPSDGAPNYDFRTRYGENWGLASDYQVEVEESLDSIREYIGSRYDA